MAARGLEPRRLSAQDPKSCVSANFTKRPVHSSLGCVVIYDNPYRFALGFNPPLAGLINQHVVDQKFRVLWKLETQFVGGVHGLSILGSGKGKYRLLPSAGLRVHRLLQLLPGSRVSELNLKRFGAAQAVLEPYNGRGADGPLAAEIDPQPRLIQLLI